MKPGNCTIVEHPFSRAYYFRAFTLHCERAKITCTRNIKLLSNSRGAARMARKYHARENSFSRLRENLIHEKKVFYSTCIPQLCALLDDITYFYSITFMFSGDRAFHADIDFAFDLLPTNPKLVGLSTISTTAIISRSIWNRHKML